VQREVLGCVVFAVTYVLVAGRRLRWIAVDRPAGALVGAVLAVAVGAITPDEAARAIDHSTLVLLFAVMGMGAFLGMDGFFDRAAPALARWARSPARLLGALVWVAGLLSALVTNDAVCVLFAPVVVDWIERWRLPRLPFLLALATGANTGSVATLVGNPQNMLCGSLGHLSFATFAWRMVPVALVALAINHTILHRAFATSLAGTLEAEDVPTSPWTRRTVFTLVVIACTVAVYSAGAHLAYTALAGFVVLLLGHRADPAEVWKRIDWSILLFFGGLFVAVEGLARSGAPGWVFARIPLYLPPEGIGAYLRTAMYFLVGSNVVTNVPFILIVQEQMARLPDPVLGWELLGMASTFAGNLTLLGSVANVIVAEKSERVGGLRFMEYLRVGALVGLLTTSVGTVLLVLSHRVFG
jgi:Na+/H+ antiporter NhaD/arsenite permease-like protein